MLFRSDTAESRSRCSSEIANRIQAQPWECFDGTANVVGYLHGLLQHLESSLSIVLDIQLTMWFKMGKIISYFHV